MRQPSPTGPVSRLFRFGILLLSVIVGTAVPAQSPNPYEGQPVSPPQGRIDELVFGRLKSLGIEPARLCSDAVFVRRVYLDAIGTLPTAQEARAFLSDQDPARRSKLIDRLLQRDEFADYWAMKWCDLLRVKSEFPINLWPNAVQSYHRWIRTSLKENLPYDRFAQAMLTASGSNFRVAQVNFYRAMQGNDPRTIATTVALTFMGTRTDTWPAERLTGMAAFFSRLGFKSTAEWKEQILFDDPAKSTAGAFPAAVFPDGTPARLAPGQDPREAFANWLTAPENPWFARSIANRVWSWLLGRGIVQEPDDLRPDNPPSNPELLAFLGHELVAAHFDLKHLFRLILNSQAYQLSSIPQTRDPAGEANFASYPLRRIEAEVLIDAIDQITGTTEKYTSPIPEPFTFIPENQRSIALADGSITSSFLELFGRPARDTGLESERNSRPSSAQSLHLLNSSHIQQKIAQSALLRSLRRFQGSPQAAITEIYVAILSRYPTAAELQTVGTYARTGTANPRETMVDLTWALINSDEFLYRH
jgi:hypothetical protein